MSDDFSALRSGVEGVAWPPLTQGTAALIEAYCARLERTQWLPADVIAAGQRHQLGLVAAHCARASPPFAARLEASGLDAVDLAQPGGLQRLAPLTRRDLQRGEAVFCRDVPQGHQPVTLNTTSGSTGEPIAVRRTAVNRLDWMAMTVRDHRWQRRDARLRLAVMSAHLPTVERYPNWGAPLDLIYRTGPALTVPATLDVGELHRLLRDFEPDVLVIYPSMLAALLDLIERGGEGLPGLRHLRCIGEMVHPGLRTRAEAAFGVTLEDAYTSEEFGFVALQCPEGGGFHVMEETHLVEIVDEAGHPCAPGETGRMLVTDLHNFATPLIRYDTADYAVAGEACRCGRGLARIERIVGRERNLVIKPDGTRHWPLSGNKRFGEIAPVNQYQLVQHDLETIEARLVTERPLGSEEEAALTALMRSALGYDFAIRFSYFDGTLPTGPGGKFEEFVCRIGNSGD
jgi:phenylacetate-CoA ligase